MKVAPISLRVAVGVSVALGIGWLILSSRPPLPPPFVGPRVPLKIMLRGFDHDLDHAMRRSLSAKDFHEVRRVLAATRRHDLS